MKKMRLILLLLLSIEVIVFNNLFSQDAQIIDYDVNPGQVLDEMPIPAPKLEGSVYLNDAWCRGALNLKTAKMTWIKGIMLRYDISNVSLEIKTDEYVKICEVFKLKEFYLINESGDTTYYQNASNFDKGISGVFEMLHSSSDFAIGKKVDVEIKDPDYLPALDVGERNKKVVRKESYYLIRGNQVLEFRRSKNSIMSLFPEKKDEMKNYIKKNKPNFKNNKDLICILTHFNKGNN